jgi:signal transduction histidine kinase
MRKLQLILCFLVGISVYAQEFSPEYTNKELKSLPSDSLKAAFIHEHFYKIYSASFENADSLTAWGMEKSQQANWTTLYAFLSMDKGVTNYLQGKYDIALPLYLQSSRIFDSLQHLEGIARVNNEMAVYYHKQDKLKEAYACLDKSEAAAIEGNLQEHLGTSLAHRSAFLIRRKKYEEAYPYIQRVYEIRQATNDSVGLGYVLLDLADYELQQGNFNACLRYIKQSTKIRKAIGDVQGVAVNTVIMGETYYNIKRYQEAIPYFKKTVTLASDIGYTDLLRFSYEQLEKSYVNLGQYQNAYLNQKQSQALKDSLFNLDRSKVIEELQAQYETEKKEKQLAIQEATIAQQDLVIQRDRILLAGAAILILALLIIGLQVRNRLKLKQEKQIEEAKSRAREQQIQAVIESQERERNRFSRDLHDTFGQLISVLNLNMDSLQKADGQLKKQDIFKESTSVLEDMYQELKNVCFNLMPQSLVKNGLQSALEEFSNRINQTGKLKVELNVFGLDERLQDLQEISLYRISQEWVNNILKYGDATQVTLQVTRDEEELSLLIEDNGSGFDRSALEEGKGNGWKNIQSRSNLIRGELELDTQTGRRGSTLILNAPAHLGKTVKSMELV